MSVAISDPFHVADDPRMPFLARALDPVEVQRQFAHRLGRLTGDSGRVSLQAIRVVRHKPGRRCVIEYDLAVAWPDRPGETITLVGKARARGLDAASYLLVETLWNTGFRDEGDEGVAVPEPVGIVPEFQMWLQRKVPGTPATRLLAGPEGVALAERIAEAAHTLHQADIPPQRRHTMADELRILHERLAVMAQSRPAWADRLARLLAACDQLGTATREPEPRGIHRDFYPDQVLVDGRHLYLLDLDLYCLGDPALDIGNFAGHITEQSLRTLGDPDALADREEALVERFVAFSGEATRAAVRAYTILTLVRHISLSTQIPGRGRFTQTLLDLCEQRLGISVGSRQ